jgi:hypothetical protein
VSQTGGFRQVRDDLATFDTSVVVLVDEEGLDNDEDLVDVRADEIVELVEDAVDDLDEQMTLLVLESSLHEEREDLVKERTGAELASLVGDLTEGGLAHGRGSILDLQEKTHDLALLQLLDR